MPSNNFELKKNPQQPVLSLSKPEKQRDMPTYTVPFYLHNRHQRNVLITTSGNISPEEIRSQCKPLRKLCMAQLGHSRVNKATKWMGKQV